ncbi:MULTISPECIES: HNH endonuclease [Bacillaceae]|uniref:HNH endonuclease n=1 Tax=Bacillaceae TaxID=186817 RepID=UPI000BF8D65E|nr:MULTISPECIES: HNH endonuclease signature motif containing protein [Bacillaceae]PFH92640.1 HNH endonuclease [Bacillus sp. AFS088145]
MPKVRVPKETWVNNVRPLIWKRDGKKCVRCRINLSLNECHIDHIKSGKFANNYFTNLRTLCRRCHVLRDDKNHLGMIASALRDEIIPTDWRKYTWEG